MQRGVLTTVVAVAVVLSAAPAPVAAQEDPRFEVYTPEPSVTPGATTTLPIQVVNDAEAVDERVKRANNVKVEVASGDTPIEVRSGTRLLGRMADGAPATFEVAVSVPANVDAGSYRLPVEITYEFDGDERATTTAYATVRVEDRARFEVESTNASAPVGSSGTVQVTLTNVGSEAASSAAVTVTSTHSDVRFGQGQSASRFVGSWEPGETRTLEYEATIAESAESRAYTLQAQVNYDDADGNARTSAPLSFGVTPLPEQTFAFESVTSTLRVGDEGTLNATVVNTGEATVENVVVAFEAPGPTVSPVETEYAVGTLEPGESANVSFTTEVSESAGAGPKQFTFDVRYRDATGERRDGDAVDVRVDVAPSRPSFEVDPVEATFAAGDGGRLTMQVTNNRDAVVRDVTAKLFADAPVSVSDDEAFVARLEPGETANVTFEVGVAGSALAKDYPVEVDFRYQTPDGETKLSDTYQVPVSVTESGEGGIPLALLAAAVGLLAIGIGTVVVYRRR